MIKIATEKDLSRIIDYIKKDYSRNYFIALGLLKGWKTFKQIYICGSNEIKGILFHRASGNLQYVTYTSDCHEVASLIRSLEFNYLISPKSFCRHIEDVLRIDREGAFIAELNHEDYLNGESLPSVFALKAKDCIAVEALYKQVFSGHPKAAFMAKKLESKRGLAYGISDESILSVAQSEFGNVIVGVATHPEFRQLGYARACLHQLINRMFEEQDKVYLQYDDYNAGKLYTSMGFKVIDQVIHYRKR